MAWFRKATYRAPGVQLAGTFDMGWALDAHSILKDGEWHRTIVGDRLYRFKYRGNRAGGRWIARTCVDFLQHRDRLRGIDLILTVPSSRQSSRSSPAEYVAARIAKDLGVPCPYRALYKTKSTRYVKEAGTLEQKSNIIANTMALRQPEVVTGKRLLLIDDLFETGATSREAIRALQEGNPDWIGFLAFTVVRGST